ncbi:hypothetical protein [Bacillus pumilus]|uniref:hypothetical protein n=1 Tax=Bacillus pumilus TaxID=1408 RepID=UPI0011A29619|nr:hypothetical protein [Bacillus pumilus]
MNKTTYTFMLLACMLLLVSCNNNSESDAKTKTEKKEEYTDDGKLTEVGQRTKGENEEIYELTKRTITNKRVDISPLSITINRIDFIRATNLTDEMIDSLQLGVDIKLKDPVNYMEVSLTAENKGNIDLIWPYISYIILNTKEQINAKSNNIFKPNNFEIYSGAKKEETLGIIFNSDPNEVNEITLIFDSSVGNGETITKEKKVKIAI